jgi:hypothetical protein
MMQTAHDFVAAAASVNRLSGIPPPASISLATSPLPIAGSQRQFHWGVRTVRNRVDAEALLVADAGGITASRCDTAFFLAAIAPTRSSFTLPLTRRCEVDPTPHREATYLGN